MIIVEEDQKNIFKGKNILVVGLARSGTGAANLLSGFGACVSVTDRKPRSSLEGQIKRLSPAVQVIINGDADELIDSADMIVISPGVPADVPLLVKAGIRGIPVIGELEVAYQIIRQEARGKGQGAIQSTGPDFIGITGTNGKSTTTTLVDLMLGESGCRTLLGGNIGSALTEELLKTGINSMGSAEEKNMLDYVVAEISSFQLESIDEFRPGIAAILNITPDHLDRYDDMSDYANAKARIFENQTSEDILIVNADDLLLMNLIDERMDGGGEMPRIAYFSTRKEVAGVYSKGGTVYCRFDFSGPSRGSSKSAKKDIEIIRVSEIKMKGIHNLENAMAASAMALAAGCSPEAVKKVLGNFPGLEHRLEFAGEMKGIQFINDSKGTNVGAVAKSLEGFESIILIMGGLDKGGNFSVLRDLVKKKVKLLIVMGEAKEKIAQELGSVTETRTVTDLGEAVALSVSHAVDGDIVLLSPGCASFDMFADFEDRGRKFKEAVRDLINA